MCERKPILSSKRVGLIHQGESYAIEEIDGNWVRISIGKKKEGWVYSFHGTFHPIVKRLPTNRLPRQLPFFRMGRISVKQQRHLHRSLRVRMQVRNFQSFKQDGDWYEISLPSGESAFVAKWVVSTDDEDNLITEPVMKQKNSTCSRYVKRAYNRHRPRTWGQ